MIWKRRMVIVRVSIVVSVPAGLHSNLICIVRFQIGFIDFSIDPHIGYVAVRSLLDHVIRVNICIIS